MFGIHTLARNTVTANSNQEKCTFLVLFLFFYFFERGRQGDGMQNMSMYGKSEAADFHILSRWDVKY